VAESIEAVEVERASNFEVGARIMDAADWLRATSARRSIGNCGSGFSRGRLCR
jgi:hypothetical protein